MHAISPDDEVPTILSLAAGTVCLACIFFSIPVVLQIVAGLTLLAIAQAVGATVLGR